MDSLYPKLRAGFRAQWTPDGQFLQLYNRNTRQMFRLTRNSGRVLCTLDGETWPGEDTGLDDRTIYRYLRQFAACGLLEESNPARLTAAGTALWSFPCPMLRTGRRHPLLCLYSSLIRWLWLPLLAALLVVSFRSGLRLPRLSMEPAVAAGCLALCNIPALVFHELAHAPAANALRMPVSSFGIGIRSGLPCCFIWIPLMPFAPPRFCRAVCRAGPQANLCLGCALLLSMQLPLFRQEPVFLAGMLNLILAVINLLPLEGLDGYSILTSFPAMERAVYGGRCFRSHWDRFFTRAMGALLHGLTRAGLLALLLWEGMYLLSLAWEVVFA